MPKQAISVTLAAEHLTWLRGRAGASGMRSVSELLDHIVSRARASGQAGPPRSVVGTVDIDPGDPALEQADDALRACFAASRPRALTADQSSGPFRARRRTRRRG